MNMKQKKFTVMIAATALFLGWVGVANAQVTGEPWKEQWDACVLVGKEGHRRPNCQVGPYSTNSYDPVMRIYQDCPVHLDTALLIPEGKGRSLVLKGHEFLKEDHTPSGLAFKDFPCDKNGRQYLINTLTGLPFTEFEKEIKFPDASEKTPYPLSFVHRGLKEGEATYKDGYIVALHFEVTVDEDPQPLYIRYQYFQLPTVTLDYQKPGPMFPGKFELTFSGEIVKPKHRIGYDPKPGAPLGNAADMMNLSNFNKYTAGAYFSLDNGATWHEATDKMFTLTQEEIKSLPDEFTLQVKLPGGCGAFVPVKTGSSSSSSGSSTGTTTEDNPFEFRPSVPIDVTRQITLKNETGDASPELLNPLKQFYDVNSGKDFQITVRPTGGNVPVLETSRNGHTPDAGGVVREQLPDGTYRFTVRKVREDLTLTLKYTVANAEVDGTRVWGEAGQLCLSVATSGRINVYNVLGQLARNLTLSAGETGRLSLPAGVYIVTLSNGKTYKAAVR